MVTLACLHIKLRLPAAETELRMINMIKKTLLHLLNKSQTLLSSQRRNEMHIVAGDICGSGNVAVIPQQRDSSTPALTRQTRQAGTDGEGVMGRPSADSWATVCAAVKPERERKRDAKRTKITQNVMNKGSEGWERLENK